MKYLTFEVHFVSGDVIEVHALNRENAKILAKAERIHKGIGDKRIKRIYLQKDE